MKAAIRPRFGPPDVIEVSEVETPRLTTDDGVLVRVRASSLNAGDWFFMAGRPYLGRLQMGMRKPKSLLLGGDFAGIVEAVGPSVTEFAPGDEVFGMRSGALAEYLILSESKLVPKPKNLSFEQAAAVPIAGITALQALRTKGNVQPGHKVLINGASGGVGTFTVQLAKVFEADVTAVCSTRNVDMVRDLGADRVIDYTKEDFTKVDVRYDLMIDNVSSKPFSKYRRVLKPDATVVTIGGPKSNPLLGPLGKVLRARLASTGKSQKVIFFIAAPVKEDMLMLRDLIEAGKVAPVIDKSYELSEIREAFRYLAEGHARAKITITIA